MKMLPALLIATIISAGCDSGSSNNTKLSAAPDPQSIYSAQVKRQQDLLNQAKKTNNDLTEKKAEETAKAFLKETVVTADNWKATVDKIRDGRNSTYLVSQYKTHTYTMRIADPVIKDWVSTLKTGDEIIFSGELGKERSVTVEGGLRNPEFTFFPAKIRLASDSSDRTQSSESIAAALKADEEEEKRDRLLSAIDTLCEEAVRSKAFNKREADFSVLHRRITQTDSSTWRYSNDVTLKNAFGATITHRAFCTVKTRIGHNGNLQAKVTDLKFSQ